MSYFGTSPVQSSSNATTTILSGGATYTGTWEVSPRGMLLLQSYSDVVGTAYFDFSVDGVNADSTFPVSGFTASASIPLVEPAAVGGRYFRVRYVNGSSAQSVFRLGVFFSDLTNFYSPLNQPYDLQSPAILTRPSLPWLDAVRGLNTGLSIVKKFGANQSVGTSFVPITSSGTYQTPTAAVSLEFVSSSAADALDDTGAHEITVVGLDENWEEQTVSTAAHATDGTTAVSISGTWLRIYRAYVSKSGAYATASSASHVGVITVRVASAGATYATIPLVDSFPVGQTLIGAYTIPTGKTGFVFLTTIGADSGKTVNVAFFSRSSANDVSSSYNGTMRIQSLITGLSGGSVLNRTGSNIPLGPFVGPCDVGFLGLVSTGTAEISVEFEIHMVAE